MTPEETELLRRVVKLSEENNRIVKSVRRQLRWSVAWGIFKVLLIVVPLVVGYFYVKDNVQHLGLIDEAKEIIGSIR